MRQAVRPLSQKGEAKCDNNAVGTNPNWVAVGDFNGDGKLDIAVAGGEGSCRGCASAISILTGKGDGTFQLKFVTWGPFINPASIATADFNGDGKLDLVMVDNIGEFWGSPRERGWNVSSTVCIHHRFFPLGEHWYRRF